MDLADLPSPVLSSWHGVTVYRRIGPPSSVRREAPPRHHQNSVYNHFMSRIITSHHHEVIQKLVLEISDRDLSSIAAELTELISIIHKDIPEKKRISTGRYSIVKALGSEIYHHLKDAGIDIQKFSTGLFGIQDIDPFVRSIAVQLFSLVGLESGDLKTVLPVFKKAAADDDWIVRECSSGLVRKLVKKLLRLSTNSKNS